MGKIRVEELAAQMGIGSKEVLFLLQSIGVDVKSPQAALDESTVLAILQGKTHAPQQLIVRDNEARAVRQIGLRGRWRVFIVDDAERTT